MKEQHLILPALGMAQDSGLIVEWLKKPGDWVEQNDVVMAVETDKTVVEIPSPWSGRLTRILVQANQDVPVGSTVALLTSPENDAEQQQLMADDLEHLASQTVAPVAAAEESAKKIVDKNSVAAVEPQDAQAKVEVGKVVARELEAATVGGSRALALADPSEKILASPKAKSLAQRYQIRLKDLLNRSQFRQPFRADDVEQYIRLQNERPSSARVSRSEVLQLEVQLEMDKFSQLLHWLADHGEWRAVHLWLRINKLLLDKNDTLPAFNNEAGVAELRQGQIHYFRTDAASTGLPPLQAVEAIDESSTLLLGCVDDATVLNCTLASADWQFVLYRSHPCRVFIQAPSQQCTMQTLLGYGQQLAQLVADPLPHLL